MIERISTDFARTRTADNAENLALAHIEIEVFGESTFSPNAFFSPRTRDREQVLLACRRTAGCMQAWSPLDPQPTSEKNTAKTHQARSP